LGHRIDKLLDGPRLLRSTVERRLQREATSPAEHWQRRVLNQAVDRYIDSLGPGALSAAEISGNSHVDKPWRKHVSLDYPEFDLCAPLDQPERFDVTICEQVLEHVEDPSVAASNLRELTVPGGHVIVSTPFLIRVHELPEYGMRDYWRFTPRGLRTLLERAGLEVAEVGEWGNRECIAGNLYRWPAYRRWHSLRNEPDLAVQVWAFATRPR
jgi:SAM-dependent methyltransferase